MTRQLRLMLPLLGTLAGLGALGAQTRGAPAGTPAQGQTMAGAPTPSARQAGVPSPGQTPAGNPIASRSSAVPPNNTPASASGNTFQPGNPISGLTTGNFVPNRTTGATFGNQLVPGAVGPFGIVGGVTSFAPGYYGNETPGYPAYNTMPYDFGDAAQPSVGGFATNSTPGFATSFSASSNSTATMGDASTAGVARLRLLVPADAVVWIDGQRTAPTGYLRQYVSPRIDPNREYGYDIRAEWYENGHPVAQSRKITFFAGDRLTINFLDTGTERSQPVIHQTMKRAEPGNPDHAKKDDGNLMTLTPPPYASFEVASDEGAHDGVIVRVTPTGLQVKSLDERVFVYELTRGAQITCDNSACPLSALQPGMRARVTTKNNSLHQAFRVEALDHNLDFVKPNR